MAVISLSRIHVAHLKDCACWVVLAYRYIKIFKKICAGTCPQSGACSSAPAFTHSLPINHHKSSNNYFSLYFFLSIFPKTTMLKKLKFLSLFKNTDGKSSSSWTWPSCNQPKTLSFRANKNDTVFETCESILTEFSYEDFEESGLCSDRLFFEPNETSSILKIKEIINVSSNGIVSNNNNSILLPFENSVEFSMDSQNPYEDFKESIVEMVKAHGVNNWETLEKLLSWYLEVNEKSNYGFIIDAFFNLFVEFNHDSPDCSPLSIQSCSSLDSLWSIPCVSSYSSPL
jgi:uncharacterized protein (TIGR01568 family)